MNGFMRLGSNATNEPPGFNTRNVSADATRGIGKVMQQSAEQDAVETGVGKWQIFDVAFEEGDVRIFGLTQGYELRAEVEPDRVETLLAQQIGEDSGTAAEIGDPGAGFPFRQPCARCGSAANCSRA